MNNFTLDLTNNISDKQFEHLRKGKAIALGYFDGIHKGHQELIRAMVNYSRMNNLEATVLSFDRYPKPVPQSAKLNVIISGKSRQDTELESPLPYKNEKFLGLLQTAEQREVLFEALGVNTLILQEFNSKYADLSPEEFTHGILTDKLNCQALFVGENFFYGKNRSGNIDTLKFWAAEKGVELFVIESSKYAGELISSTRIREAIEAGKMENAAQLLGRGYTIPGIVIHGNALGRTMGMPTANIRIPEGMVVPPYGVYESITKVDGTYYNSLTSIGLRPTVNHTDPYPLVESYILNENINLYDKYIEVELLKFERAEERFPSFIAMSAVLHEDLKRSNHYHNNVERFSLYTEKNGIPIYVSRSERFSTSIISVNVYTPLNPATFIDNVLLSRILTAATDEYPTRATLRRYLDEQFASKINTSTSIFSNLQIINFKLSFINRRFIDEHIVDADALNESSRIFFDMLLNPFWDQFYNFSHELVESEKNNLIFELNELKLSKKTEAFEYAYQHLLQKNGVPDYNLAKIDELIYRVKNISNLDLQKAWMRLFSEAYIRIVGSGDFPNNDFLKTISELFSALPRGRNEFKLAPGAINAYVKYEKAERYDYYVNEGDLANIVLVYNHLPNASSVNDVRARIISDILAGRALSIINQELSKQLGYIYGVEAKYRDDLGAIIFYLEVKASDRDRVAEIVDMCVEKIKEGNFSENLLLSSLRFLENYMYNLEDSAERRLEFFSESLLTARKYTSTELLDNLAFISKENIISVAKNMALVLDIALLPKAFLEKVKAELKELADQDLEIYGELATEELI